MLRTEGNGHRHAERPAQLRSPEGARSRKPRPVLCLGNRALNGRPTGDAEGGVARCPVTERLVGSDAVVDVAEASAIVISPDITASTICSRVSTGTGSLDLLKIVS